MTLTQNGCCFQCGHKAFSVLADELQVIGIKCTNCGREEKYEEPIGVIIGDEICFHSPFTQPFETSDINIVESSSKSKQKKE